MRLTSGVWVYLLLPAGFLIYKVPWEIKYVDNLLHAFHLLESSSQVENRAT